LYWFTPQLICRNKEKFPPDLSTARPTLKVRVDTGVKSPVLPETGVLARNAAELQTKVWKLEKRIAELEKKAAELEKRIAELEKKQKEPPGPAACGPR
jgi:predicted RNase H-like nuclease (RuvC/YqgF family)